ncbi:MAG: bifunctional diguanylate cyclase/phosphodiesterase, partial [Acidimicrobiales bacterium]
MVARLGGDEFALLLTTDASIEGAVRMADRIQTALLEPIQLDDVHLQTNASIGIAVFPDHATDADGLTQRADVAMYQAKRSGSGHAVYRAELSRKSVRRVTLLSDFRRGLEAGEFLLHFQPVIEVGTGRTVRAEALLRWLHPEHGLLAPDEFIGLAAVSGFIQPLTSWVLDRAIASAATWWSAGHRVGVAVNLSVRNLYDPGLAEHLSGLLDRHHFPPGQLMLEVTETELMDDPRLALEFLGAVHRLGVATGVDDYGTGYSSAPYLRNLPITEIKIDRSFVSGMRRRAADLTIVRSAIDLGHNLSLSVVAEGVEDARTLRQLSDLGCDLAQGFHVSRPLDVGDFASWLDRPTRDRLLLVPDTGGPVTAL